MQLHKVSYLPQLKKLFLLLRMNVLLFFTFLFLLLYVGCMLYYKLGWNRLPDFRIENQKVVDMKVSIIIPARNEELRIKPLLDSLSKLNYPKHLLEIIVVDDFSTDSTSEIVNAYSNIQLIKLQDHISRPITAYKKKALEIGIANSSGEIIVTTDADCIVPANWITTLTAFYKKQNIQMVVMPVTYTIPKNYFDTFQSLDFMSLQAITAAAISLNLHPMCNGANLSFTRKAFENVKGYDGIDKIASGDDILLLQKINNAFTNGVGYLKSEEVIVESLPTENIKSFLNQRIRWASKSTAYTGFAMYSIMIIVYFTNLCLLVFPFVAIISSSILLYGTLWILLILIKAFFEMWLLTPVAKFFGKLSMLTYFIPMQPFHILYTVLSGGLGMFGNYTWKDRKVK